MEGLWGLRFRFSGYKLQVSEGSLVGQREAMTLFGGFQNVMSVLFFVMLFTLGLDCSLVVVPFTLFFFGLWAPLENDQPKKGCPYYGMVSGLPRFLRMDRDHRQLRGGVSGATWIQAAPLANDFAALHHHVLVAC